MCDFVKGIIREKDEEVLIFDAMSHSLTAEHFGLKGDEYREWEWTKDNQESLVVRVPPNHDKNENRYKSIIISKYPTRYELIQFVLKNCKNENIIKNSKDAIEAVKQNGDALRYVRDRNESICIEAVKQNGDALRYVRDQNESICIEAVKQNGDALQYVRDQNESNF